MTTKHADHLNRLLLQVKSIEVCFLIANWQRLVTQSTLPNMTVPKLSNHKQVVNKYIDGIYMVLLIEE